MSAFNNEYNYHDSKIRSIIISVLNEFKEKLTFRQYTNSNEYDTHTVPFYYSLTGAEDFLLDHFMTKDYSALSEQELNNNYEPVPRGILTMTSLEIDAGALINKHIRVSIPVKIDDKTYRMYSYETMIVPINMSFDIRIVCNSNIEMLKITESLISNMYKTNNFYVDYGGYHVRGSMSLPESYEREQLLEFSFTDKKQYDLSFSVEISTSFPIFDEKSEMFLGNKIDSFDSNIYDISVDPSEGMFSNTGDGIVAGKDAMKYDENKIEKDDN